jgi:hypothetical protein
MDSNPKNNRALWSFAIGSIICDLLCLLIIGLSPVFSLLGFLFGLNVFLIKRESKPRMVRITAAVGLAIGLFFVLFIVYAMLQPYCNYKPGGRHF